MTKKEISEIRKQCRIQENSFTTICGCYVPGNDQEKICFTQTFQTLAQEDAQQSLALFKKGLSGKPDESLSEGVVSGEVQESLLALTDCGLRDPKVVNRFFDAAAESFAFGTGFLILLIHNCYDIPKPSGSDTAYSYIQCLICPIQESVPELGYQGKEKGFASTAKNWIVKNPAVGFLYPAFNDRCTDIHHMLAYIPGEKRSGRTFIENLLGTELPMPRSSQCAAFRALAEQGLGENLTYQAICSLKESLDMITENDTQAGEEKKISWDEAVRIIEEAGEKELEKDTLPEQLKEAAEFRLSNLAGGTVTEIQTNGALIRIDRSCTPLPEIGLVSGRKYILVPVGESLEIDGFRVFEGEIE